MTRFLPFTLGLLAGAVAVNVARSGNIRSGGEKARKVLRDATVSGLAAVEHSSAKMRAKLESGEGSPAGGDEAGA